jgi:predicted GNAT superfamily acetyltransferase
MTDPWSRAHEAAQAAGVELRPLTTVDDAERIGSVIVATWGEQPIGPEVVRALAESGNEPYGAWSQEQELVGFVLGWAGVDQDGLHVHSHMLATLPDRRHTGVGYALKLAQRAQALDHGIHVVRWTFDPLVARNAHFNLGKLGAIGDRFERDFYGAMADALNQGDRTDRVTARWDLDVEPLGSRVPAPPVASTVLERTGDPTWPEPLGHGLEGAVVALVEIPDEYHQLRAIDAALSGRWRDAAADAFETCIRGGLVASGFDRSRSAYVFTRGDLVRADPGLDARGPS